MPVGMDNLDISHYCDLVLANVPMFKMNFVLFQVSGFSAVAWSISPNSSFGPNRLEESESHSTHKIVIFVVLLVECLMWLG